jgi:hypothetical protein
VEQVFWWKVWLFGAEGMEMLKNKYLRRFVINFLTHAIFRALRKNTGK